MDPLNYIKEKDSSEQTELLRGSEPLENHCLGSVDHHPLDDVNACIEYDLFMRILEEHNEPEHVKGRCKKGFPEYARQCKPNNMKYGIVVDGAIEKRKILQEDATESENKWPKRKRFKRGTLEYAQRQEFNKIKNRMAAARSLDKVQNHILELEQKVVRMRRENDNRRKLLAHGPGPSEVGGFRPLRRTFSGPL
ncbi:uncharacterized protein LOC108959274 [Eucalyptus grandis]|uniref:uncharacterized protein LOC108959274 n=1 Tax=Eucalyptus grandis TaxID=71139 RepID=UPI00192F0E18|nr:uncharacterized protein LOC108959274 [Eucalyptus grandis]